MGAEIEKVEERKPIEKNGNLYSQNGFYFIVRGSWIIQPNIGWIPDDYHLYMFPSSICILYASKTKTCYNNINVYFTPLNRLNAAHNAIHNGNNSLDISFGIIFSLLIVWFATIRLSCCGGTFLIILRFGSISDFIVIITDIVQNEANSRVLVVFESHLLVFAWKLLQTC